MPNDQEQKQKEQSDKKKPVDYTPPVPQLKNTVQDIKGNAIFLTDGTPWQYR